MTRIKHKYAKYFVKTIISQTCTKFIVHILAHTSLCSWNSVTLSHRFKYFV